jgi:peptidoglycan-associated lipoprotein
MNRIWIVLGVMALGLLLGGCPKKPTTVPPATSGETVAGPQAGAATSGAAGAESGRATPLPGAAGPVAAAATAGTTVYFDFDSSEVRPEFAAAITSHAKRLAAERALRVRLEGNTDERGSAEYNVALGERRAQSVKRALLLQGATEAQLTTVSYGAERPAVEGHDEAAWSKNRRVEIVFLGGR